MIEEFWTNFTKKQIQRIENESLRTRLNKSISQGDADNNLSVKNEINYDYVRTNNKGIILLPESLRIDTTSKIESLMIKLKSIDTNENKKIKFSIIPLSAVEDKLEFKGRIPLMHLYKSSIDTIKYFRIVSNLWDI